MISKVWCLWILAVWILGGWCNPVQADGWHGAAMSTSSIDDWLNDLKTVIPDIKDRLKTTDLQSSADLESLKKKLEEAKKNPPKTTTTTTPPRGGKLDVSKMSPQQKALLGKKAMDCMEILAWLDRPNIYPSEFPMFPVEKIGLYRATAKELLGVMGPAGVSAISSRVRAELMGSYSAATSDVKPHADYHRDLLEALDVAANEGTIFPEDLKAMMEAAAGNKSEELASLGNQSLDIMIRNADMDTLQRTAESLQDPTMKRKLLDKISERMEQANYGELLDIAKNARDPGVKNRATQRAREWLETAPISKLVDFANTTSDNTLKRTVSNSASNRVADAPAAELVDVLQNLEDATLRDKAVQALNQRSPTYGEMSESIEGLKKLSESNNAQISAAAKSQIANAFQRAPISECLKWLGQEDKKLNDIIWPQIDGRIARADEDRKAGYRETAVGTLKDKNASGAVQTASLELMQRLKDLKTAAALVETLSLLPRERWPQAGETLRKITGQNFGPFAGAEAASVIAETRKWRAWLKEQGVD